MKLALRPNALLCLVSLLAACGTDAATRARTENGGEDTASTDTAVDTAPDGSGDTSTDTNADTTADTTPDGSGDTGTVEPTCGDGIVDDGEGCDDGLDNSDIAPDACRTNCLPASCGDANLDSD